MPSPSILTDGSQFFINVLNANPFRQMGFMTRTEGRVSWSVLDPRRHVMTIWEKDKVNFVNAATDRNASTITNAPFLIYNAGSREEAYIGYHLHSLVSSIGFGIASLVAPDKVEPVIDLVEGIHDESLQVMYFGARSVEGYIYGTSESIVENTDSRPNASYFGRNQGRLFGDYVVARGDPPRMNEVIGGLFRNVENYVAVDNGSASQVGAWGLAPILSAPVEIRENWMGSGFEEALEGYEEAASSPGEVGIPYGEGVESTNDCSGLVVALFGGGSPKTFANILSAVLVKEAVRVDGNSSILLATGASVLQGAAMPYYKQKYNKWGYMFQAG